MIVKDERLLKQMREAMGLCEFCESNQATDVHHILARGHGGGNRMDVAINLVTLCREPCHREAQAGKIPADVLLAIAAKRELWKLARTPKGSDV